MAENKKAGAKPPTKSEIYAHLADSTGLTKKDVAAVFDSLSVCIDDRLGLRGCRISLISDGGNYTLKAGHDTGEALVVDFVWRILG